MRKTAFFSILLALAALTACSPDIYEPSASDARKVVAKSTYVQDSRTGICYNIVLSASSESLTPVVSHTAVPCDKIPAELLAR
jgi:hypothetical protein